MDLKQHQANDLTYAVKNGDVKAVTAYLDQGYAIDGVNYEGITALHRAVLEGRKELIELLLARGADIHAKDTGLGATALHFAANLLIPGKSATVAEIMELLIAKGADVNARDASGRTPLRYTKPMDLRELAKILERHGGKE